MAIKERLRLPLYDTEVLAAGAIAIGDINMFNQGVGGKNLANATKKDIDTNLSTNGQMPYSAMTVFGIRVYMYTRTAVPLIGDNLNFLLGNCLIDYRREDRDITKLPIHWFPSGIGYNVGGQATSMGWGTPALSNMYKILPEKYVQSQRIQLAIKVQNTLTMTVDCYIQVMLEGISDKGM